MPEPTPEPTGIATEPAAATITKPNDNAVVLAQLRDLDERNRSLQAKVDELSKPREPEIPLGEQNKAFWNDPVTMLRKELKDTVAPLIEFRDEFRSASAYDRVKSEYKNSPQYKEFMAKPGVEGYVDQIMAKNRGLKDEKEIGQALQAAILSVSGAISLGLIEKPVEPSDTTKKEPDLTKKVIDPVTIPPHLRPSAAPQPGPGAGTKTIRELSEYERRQARENKLTDAEYVELTDTVQPAGVVGWKSEAEKKKEEGK